MDWLELLIAAFAGGIGANAIAELIKSHRAEFLDAQAHKKWLREKRYEAYTEVSGIIASLQIGPSKVSKIALNDFSIKLNRIAAISSDGDIYKEILNLISRTQDLMEEVRVKRSVSQTQIDAIIKDSHNLISKLRDEIVEY